MKTIGKSVIATETVTELRALFEDGLEAQTFLNDLIKIYLETGRESVQSLSRTLDAGDLPAVGRHAHKLKGLSRNIGAQRVGDLCADLEVEVMDQGSNARDLYEALVSEFQQACDELNQTYLRVS